MGEAFRGLLPFFMLCLRAFRIVEEVEMSQTITAVYADGVLRPVVPLELENYTQVELEVREIKNTPSTNFEERKRIIEAMERAGLLANTPAIPFDAKEIVSEEEEGELAQIFAGEKPLSEIIIEERQEGW
jgi:predicted DNA-binding antitoxin AbrB/MazE fold protein